MDILFMIAIVALGIIIAVVGVGIFNVFNDNTIECEEMNKNIYEAELALNQSAEHYRYRASALAGQFDLPGDLLAWKNNILNDFNQLRYEHENFDANCQS